MKTKLFYTALMAGALAVSGSQAQTRYTAQQLSEDLDSIHSKILQVHVTPHLFISAGEMQTEVDRIRGTLNDTMTRLDFYTAVTPLLTRLNDQNTNIQKPEDEITRYGRAIPLQFDLNAGSGSLTLWQDLSDEAEKIPQGAEILSINGHPVAEIIPELLRYVYAGGRGDRHWFLEYSFEEYYYIRYRENTFEIAYRHDGKNFTRKLKGQPFDGFRGKKKSRSPHYPKPVDNFTIRFDEPNKAGIVMVHELLDDDNHTFSVRLQELLRNMKEKGIDNLVLDLRAFNGGHTHMIEELMRYLATEPFTIFRSKTRHSSYTLATTDDLWAKAGWEEISDDEQRPFAEGKRYSGNLYVLTSATIFPMLVCPLLSNNNCKIIGEEVWNPGISFQENIRFTLPNTKLQQSISWRLLYLSGVTDENIPDIRPHYSVPAAEAMNKALELTGAR